MNQPIYINGIGILAPGIKNWHQAAAIFRDEQTYQITQAHHVTVSLMSGREKRRANKTTLLAMHVAEEAIQHAHTPTNPLSLVFASYANDLHIADKMCRSLAMPEPFISPTLFHNSVHNAPAAYWSIATHTTTPATSISCGQDSFCAALLESYSLLLTEDNDVLLTTYDIATPAPLNTQHPANANCAVALVLSKQPTTHTIATLSMTLVDEPTPIFTHHHPELNTLIQHHASMQAIALLAPIAQQKNDSIKLKYFNQSIVIQLLR